MAINSIEINENLLEQMIKLQEQLQIANNKKTTENKKRKKGSYQLMGNGKARLYYMLNKVSYRDIVEAKNDEEALNKLALFVEQVEKGQFINTNYTFGEFAQIWLDEKVRPNAGERCVKKYIGALNKRILPSLGNIKLKDLTKQKLEKYFNTIKESKTNYEKRKENNTVKPATVHKWKSIIHACLEYAVECELIHKNPCDKIKITFTNTTDENTLKELVKNKREKIGYYTLDEYKHVCDLLETEFKKYYNDTSLDNEKRLREVGRRFLILLDLKTGMRRSELFGLAKNDDYYDLNYEDATFDVNKSRHYLAGKGRFTKYAKNETSIRKKSLPKSILSYLDLYYKLLNNLHYENMYIFDYLSIDGICSWFSDWQEKNKIKKIRFHDIRHTHATILLYKGVDVKTISERLGHADIQTTLDIYADVLKELDIQAANKLDEI